MNLMTSAVYIRTHDGILTSKYSQELSTEI